MNPTNPYCESLGIPVPSLEQASMSPDANYYSLLIVVLLERGGPVTLEQAARRFEEAGVARADEALRSLKRCKPARAPIYRDGDLYALDPHDDETDMWAFRLGLRPAKAQAIPPLRILPTPLPEPDQHLTVAILNEAWRDGVPSGWSAQRVAICVLDAHGGAMIARDALEFANARSKWSQLSAESARYWRRGAAVHADDDGLWRLDPQHDAVLSARQATRDRLEFLRRYAHMRPDPAVIAATQERLEQERQTHAGQLARVNRVLLHAFPAKRPEALVLLDVRARALTTLVGDELARAAAALAGYDMIVAVQVRELLRALGVDPGARRLSELGPPQKSMMLNRRGRTLKITTSLLVQGTCGISQPFGDDATLRGYLNEGEHQRLRRRLEADAKSLYALYQYGRLHGTVRLRWGFLDERFAVPWVHHDERKLYDVVRRAFDLGVPLEVVIGSAPGWETPWSRVRRAYPVKPEGAWRLTLVDEQGMRIHEGEIQLARVAGEGEEGI